MALGLTKPFRIAVIAAGVITAIGPVEMTARDANAQDTNEVLVKRVVVANELGRGIKAEIRLVDDSDKETHFAYTDDLGVAEPNLKCQMRHRLVAKPTITNYRILGRPRYCAGVVTITVHLPPVSFVLAEVADKASQDGKYGLATMLYTEAAWRISDVDPDNAEKFEFRAYDALSKELKVGRLTVFDPKQNKTVLSQDGVTAIKAFQKMNDIRPSGVLDGRTARTLAGEPLFPHIRSAYQTSKVEIKK